MFRSKRGAQLRPFVYKKASVSATVMSVLALLVYANLYRITPTPVAAQQVALQTPIITRPAVPAPAPAPLQTPEPQPVAEPVAIAPVPAARAVTPICTPVGTYAAPRPLSFRTDSPLVTRIIEQPAYYQVYGENLPELRKNVLNCPTRRAIAGSYHAMTARQVSWSYGISEYGDGTCSLRDIHLGVHLAQLLPLHTPNSATADAWNRYSANLTAHENGHTSLAIEHVERLGAKLSTFGRMNCSLLRSDVANTISSSIAILDTEDTLYDSRTNHGTTQGAVL